MFQQQHVQWSADEILPGFEATILRFPDDYDGPVYATLVRRTTTPTTRKALLYLHGYMDYFFQAHLADQCNQHGFDFYALDLRKYGRSIGRSRHPNFCKDISEYFAEISAALLIVTEHDRHDWAVLSGHSTGGLIGALYADSGEEKGRINALFLNSPFFDFNLNFRTRLAVLTASRLAPVRPFAAFERKSPVPYIQSIHAEHHGEWSFDLRWRPINSFPSYSGWLRAIVRAHQRVRRGLSIRCPVLVMHSDTSVHGNRWHPGFQAGDGVLNVAHIREGSRHLGPNVTVVEIKNGLHDLVLSRPDVRERVFKELFGWLAGLSPTSARKGFE